MLMNFESCDDLKVQYVDYCFNLDIEVIRECPICHFKILPNLIAEVRDDFYYILLQCTNCGELFTVKYSKTWNGGIDELVDINPKEAKEITVPHNVKEISPMFIEIYGQASTAEEYNLNQIVGIGYRKSLEFLIKDYLKHKLPEKSNEIEEKFLGKCIDMIENANIKRMAKGATWIGNDETHYIRKWEDKDIEDLKKLIDLTLTWIDLELKTEEYSIDMNL
jgi:hypothetical protein